MSECIVLNLDDIDDWPDTWGGFVKIPANRQATALQPDREAAEREAVRLLLACRGKLFAVLHVVATVDLQEIATHKTLGGAVITSTKPVWEDR